MLNGFIPTPKDGSIVQSEMKVAQLIDFEQHTWRTSLLRNIFNPTSAQAILSIRIPSTPCPDKLMWITDSKGLFSIKSAYNQMISNTPSQASFAVIWSKIWKIRGPERIKMFLWRVATNTLPTRENLMTRMDITEPWCVLYNQEVESASHLFFKCPAVKAL